ncbi:SGNH hydrolase-type esterase domain-containing protein [Xylaria intraflava]|nr:SGNH hydrolase-type esterase domain-containing protein [Xylaria intraflava]
MSSQAEKQIPSPVRKPFTWLKTRRAIALLTLLVVVSIVLAVLGANNILTPHSQSDVRSQASSVNDGVDGAGGSNATSSNHGGTSDDGRNDKSGNHGGSANHTKSDPTENTGPWRPANSSTIADGTPLRIMCLGASIVKGERSTDENGFRNTFRMDLAGQGAPINMVGSQRRGNMVDNDHEAYGGNRVSQTHEHATHIVSKMRPNVFIINVGTNNVLQYKDTDVAGADMESLIDYLLEASPRSTVVLSTLLTNTVPDREPLILDINRQYREVFRKYENRSVVLAELHPSSGLPGRPQVEDIGPDGSHPTDAGYVIMGHILADAVKDADSRGYLRWPEDNWLAYDGETSRLM